MAGAGDDPPDRSDALADAFENLAAWCEGDHALVAQGRPDLEHSCTERTSPPGPTVTALGSVSTVAAPSWT